MNRRIFLSALPPAIIMLTKVMSASPAGKKPALLYFEDDGVVPNSKYPVLLYRSVFNEHGERGAVWLEQTFLKNNWYNSWRNGIFTFQHYHSIAHEVLGIYNGEARVLLGGEQGKIVDVGRGDVIIIPAGVGHKNIGDHDLGVVGAYPDGMAVDVLRCLPGERPAADHNIARVPLPRVHPLHGSDGVKQYWRKKR